MTFSTSTRSLLGALDVARSATPSNPALSAYAGVLLSARDNRLTATGADGELGIEAHATVEVTTPGEVLVAPAALCALLRSVPGEAPVTVEMREELEIRVEGLQPYRLRTINATLPPLVRPESTEHDADLSPLADALAAVRPALGRDIGGIQLVTNAAGLQLRATDTYRLHAASLALEGLPDFAGVLPAVVVARIADIGATSLVLDPHARVLQARSESASVTSRLLGVPFPAVDALLSTTPPKRVTLDVRATLTALQRLQAVADAAPVRVQVQNGTALIEASNVEIGSGAEHVPAVGDDIAFTVARPFLADAIAAHRAAEVTLGYSGPNQALVVDSSAPFPVRCIVMPVRQ